MTRDGENFIFGCSRAAGRGPQHSMQPRALWGVCRQQGRAKPLSEGVLHEGLEVR
jgi:hypothetical protein